MSALQLESRLAAAVSMRENGELERARELLLELHRDHPDDSNVNLQCAWVHDKLGLEREAVPHYERAIELGLDGEDLRSALLGLGSTYRALGDYTKAVATLTMGVDTFPDDRAMKVFQAMALYNTNRSKEACELLLHLLSETTSDTRIRSYDGAIDVYATNLDRTWP